MSDTPSSLEPVVQLGGAQFRLPGRYATIFLMPPDYRAYVVADASARVYREYDLDTGAPGRTVIGPDHYGPVSLPSADGTRIVALASGDVQVLDLANPRVVFTLPPEPEPARFALAPTGDRLAVLVRNPDTEQREADGDMEDVYISAVVVYDLATGARQREFHPLVNFGVSAGFSPDGRLLAVSGEWREEYDDQPAPFDGSELVQVWDVATGTEVFRLAPPESTRRVYATFGGGLVLINSAHYNRPFGTYQLATARLVCEYDTRYPHLEQAVLSPDGNLLVGVRKSGELVRRDARTGATVDVTPCPFRVSPSPTTVYDEHTKQIAFRADGTVVVLRVVEQSVEVWTAPDGRPVTRASGGTAPITAVGFTADGKEVRTAGRGEAVVRRWDARTGALLGATNLPAAVVECCLGRVWLDPADRLVAQSRYGSAVFHLDTGAIQITHSVYEEATLGESLSADGWRVSLPTHYRNETDVGVRLAHINGGGSQEIYRFDSTAAAAAYGRGHVLLVYDDRQGKRRTVACLRVALSGKTELIWSRTLPIGLEYRKSYSTGIDHSRVNFSVSEPAVVWAADGMTALVVPPRERVPFLIDPDTGETLSVWASAVGRPHAVHPSRPVLATATADGDGLILADWRTGTQLVTVREGRYPHALAWSSDGTRLAVSLSDGTALVFDAGSV